MPRQGSTGWRGRSRAEGVLASPVEGRAGTAACIPVDWLPSPAPYTHPHLSSIEAHRLLQVGAPGAGGVIMVRDPLQPYHAGIADICALRRRGWGRGGGGGGRGPSRRWVDRYAAQGAAHARAHGTWQANVPLPETRRYVCRAAVNSSGSAPELRTRSDWCSAVAVSHTWGQRRAAAGGCRGGCIRNKGLPDIPLCLSPPAHTPLELLLQLPAARSHPHPPTYLHCQAKGVGPQRQGGLAGAQLQGAAAGVRPPRVQHLPRQVACKAVLGGQRAQHAKLWEADGHAATDRFGRGKRGAGRHEEQLPAVDCPAGQRGSMEIDRGRGAGCVIPALLSGAAAAQKHSGQAAVADGSQRPAPGCSGGDGFDRCHGGEGLITPTRVREGLKWVHATQGRRTTLHNWQRLPGCYC